jgi:hypothetical protein
MQEDWDTKMKTWFSFRIQNFVPGAAATRRKKLSQMGEARTEDAAIAGSYGITKTLKIGA